MTLCSFKILGKIRWLTLLNWIAKFSPAHSNVYPAAAMFILNSNKLLQPKAFNTQQYHTNRYKLREYTYEFTIEDLQAFLSFKLRCVLYMCFTVRFLPTFYACHERSCHLYGVWRDVGGRVPLAVACVCESVVLPGPWPTVPMAPPGCQGTAPNPRPRPVRGSRDHHGPDRPGPSPVIHGTRAWRSSVPIS